MDWRGFYMKQHDERKGQATSVVKFVEHCSQCESLEAIDYLRAIEYLKKTKLGSKDVQLLLLNPKSNVLVNLVGLHYCLKVLQVADWRGFYMKQHDERKGQDASVVKFVEHCSQCEPLKAIDYLRAIEYLKKTKLLEAIDYLRAIEYLKKTKLGSKDVQLLLLNPKSNVLVNLVGLHYCLKVLQVPVTSK